MARVTIEDCLGNVDNRFQLVLVATKRARQILLGGQPMVAEDNDKPTVLALREIAAGHVTRDILTQPDYHSSLDDEFFGEESDAEDASEANAELLAGVEAALGEEYGESNQPETESADANIDVSKEI